MYISPVSNNFYKSAYANRSNNLHPNFKGSLSDTETKRVLEMLKPVVTDIKTCNSIFELKTISDNLIKKYSRLNIDSIGMMVINNKDLTSFSQGRISQNETTDKIGLCIAVGNKYGPIEIWDTAYEANLILLPKKLFEKNM